MNTCEPHEVSLCNIHVIQNCLLLFLLRPQKRAKLITIKILKYLEPPSVVEQFWIGLNKQNDIVAFRTISHPLFSQPLNRISYPKNNPHPSILANFKRPLKNITVRFCATLF